MLPRDSFFFFIIISIRSRFQFEIKNVFFLHFSYGRVYAADPYATALAAPTAAAYGVGAMVCLALTEFVVQVRLLLKIHKNDPG